MNLYSNNSQRHLNTCCEELQQIFAAVLQIYDCTIIEGHRTKEIQDEYFRTKKSKVEYPDSQHNALPSNGVDVAPYPILWNDRERFVHFAGIVKGVAAEKGYTIRWGGDWDNDNDLKDQTFMDLVHFEIIR